MDNIIQLRAVDRKRLDRLQDRTENPLVHEDIWYIHTVLAQCFLPYRDPKTRDWIRKNGNYSIFLTAGLINDPRSPANPQIVGLPYGAKPRLFQSYICTQVIKQQSPVVSVERSMTAIMHELGPNPTTTLLAKSKTRGNAVLHTMSESQRDHGVPLVTRTPKALEIGHCALTNRVNRDEVCHVWGRAQMSNKRTSLWRHLTWPCDRVAAILANL